MSFLDVKTHLFLSYMQFLYLYMLFKSQGKPIHDHPIIKRLIYLKSLLLKLKPVEKKLDYQINKLLRMGSMDLKTIKKDEKEHKIKSGPSLAAEEDPLNFKVNPYFCFSEIKIKGKTRKTAKEQNSGRWRK